MAGVVLSPSSVSVAPGGDAVCTLTVRNTSAIVESYAISVLGDAAAWATPTPASLSLFPGADGTCTIHFRPPRNQSTRAGAVDFAVRIAATQNADDTVVEEGTVTVEPFVDIAARLTPRTSETKRAAKHVVTVDNRGNAPVTVSISATDPDELLAFDADPSTITVDPGETGAVALKVAATSGFMRGPAQHRPFQVTVTPPADNYQLPITLDGTLMQKAGLPKFIPVLAAAAVILVLAAVLLPGLTKNDGGKGTFSLTGASATTAPPTAASEDDAGGEGEAEAEVDTPSAKPGGEKAAVTTAPPKADTPVAGAGGVQAPTATTAKPVTTEQPTATTEPDAQPIAAALPKPRAGLPILYPSFEGDTDEEIWKVNPDGSGRVKLTNGNNANHAWSVGARWNYAGTLITYTHAPVASYTRAYIMNPDGSSPRDATPSCGTSCGQPAFSPDGTKLVYIRDSGGGHNDIWVADVSASGSTSNHKALVATSADEQYPAFAPDGRLAFQRNEGGVWKIVVRQTNGTEAVVANGQFPSWAPTNDRLLFATGDIFVLRLDGSAPVNVTAGTSSQELWPFWSADGGTIGFGTTRFGGVWHVALADANGANVRPVTSSAWPGRTGDNYRRHHWIGGWF